MGDASCIDEGINKSENKGWSIKSSVGGSRTFIKSFGSCFSATTNVAKLKENERCLDWVQQ
eukprot:13214712-Ditylum_brightwellii.AAC.2